MDIIVPQITIREGSTTDSFDIEILIPMEVALPDYSEGMRALAHIQPGGRLLLYDQVKLDGKLIRVMLTLLEGHEEGSYLVVGELYGGPVPEETMAILAIDDQPYETSIKDQKIEFADVHIPPGFGNIRLRLKTLQ